MLYVCTTLFFFFSSRRRHTRYPLVTGVQTCALPIWSNGARDQAREEWSIRAVADYGSNSRARYTYHSFNLAGLSQGTAGKHKSKKRQIVVHLFLALSATAPT